MQMVRGGFEKWGAERGAAERRPFFAARSAAAALPRGGAAPQPSRRGAYPLSNTKRIVSCKTRTLLAKSRTVGLIFLEVSVVLFLKKCAIMGFAASSRMMRPQNGCAVQFLQHKIKGEWKR
jgi:hypothetical protein